MRLNTLLIGVSIFKSAGMSCGSWLFPLLSYILHTILPPSHHSPVHLILQIFWMSGISAPNSNGSSPLLTTVKWVIEADQFLGDFVEKTPLPHVALVTKGQYLTIGAPNVANPGLKPYVLVHSVQRVKKVLGQLVKVKDGRAVVLTTQKVSIPEGYEGFFEILSEDGKPVKCLESVKELSEKFPELALVRQNCKAYLPELDGELRSLYRTRTVQEGEVLTVVGQFNFKQTTFLRCFDESGSSVYLKMSQKGKFSPVAKKDSITGVHYIKNLLNKRLPLTVRLIQGQFPTELKGFAPPLTLRLLKVYKEKTVFAYSLQKDLQYTFIPVNAHLKLAPASNHPQVVCHTEFRDLCDHCESVLPTFLGRIQPYFDPLFGDETNSTGVEPPTPQEEKDFQTDFVTRLSICDEEIDQLYDYIRGLAPLPQNLQANGKPPPPPIETIPTRSNTQSSTKSGNGAVRNGQDSTPQPTVINIADQPVSNGKRNSSDQDLVDPKTNSDVIQPEKRLDAVIYGGNKLLATKEPKSSVHHLRPRMRMSKSTEKLFDEPKPHHHYGANLLQPPDGSYYVPPSRSRHPSRQRPLSLVIPDSVPLNQQAVDYSFYQHQPAFHQPAAYRSFVNLTGPEESGGPQPPPMFHQQLNLQRSHMRPLGPFVSNHRPVPAFYPRYAPSPRYLFQSHRVWPIIESLIIAVKSVCGALINVWKNDSKWGCLLDLPECRFECQPADTS